MSFPQTFDWKQFEGKYKAEDSFTIYDYGHQFLF